MKGNLHTHSFYCGHGSGSIAEYVAEAERNGFGILGFSEHCPFADDFLSRSRMPYRSQNLYENDVRSQTCPFPVLLGYEVDYLPSRLSYYRKVRERVDYLIGGTHYIFRPDGSFFSVFDEPLSSADIVQYAKQTIQAMSSGLFAFYAHPDVFLTSHPFDSEARAVTDAILDSALELSLPLEINGNGYMRGRGYPSRDFWLRAAERGVPAVLSSDAHRVSDLAAPFDYLRQFAAECGAEILEVDTAKPLRFRKERAS